MNFFQNTFLPLFFLKEQGINHRHSWKKDTVEAHTPPHQLKVPDASWHLLLRCVTLFMIPGVAAYVFVISITYTNS
jgi:hypothetical protein